MRERRGKLLGTAGSRAFHGGTSQMSEEAGKPTVFVSYSHKDEVWKDRLKPHLRMLEHEEQLILWDDRRIDAGDKWYPQLKQAISRAAVALCLISPDYLASDFIIKEEVPFLLQRYEEGGMLLIPVLPLENCQVAQWTAVAAPGWKGSCEALPGPTR